MIAFIKTLFIEKCRAKSSYVTFIFLPILSTLLALSLSFGGDVPAKIGILDKDNSRVSKTFVNHIKDNEKYDIYTKLDEKAINQYLQDKSLEAVLILNKGFEDKVLSGQTQKLQLEAVAGSQTTEWFKAHVNYLLEYYNTIGDVAKGDKTIFNNILKQNKALPYGVTKNQLADRSRSKSVSARSTGFLLILMLGSSSMIYSAILTDKKRRLYDRLILTKITKLQYLLSYVCLGLLAYTIQIAIIIGVLKLINISFYIPWSVLLLTFYLYALLSIGFGLFVGAVSQNPQQSSQLSNLIIMPSSMLAGCLWPLSITPPYMQAIGKLLPQNWVLSIIEGYQSGANIVTVAPYLLALGVMSASLIVVSSLLMKPQSIQ